MEPGGAAQPKVEEFVELQDALWPAAHREQSPPPAAQQRQTTAGSAQRAAAYLLSPGVPRTSARRSPFLHAAEQQLSSERSGPGLIPGQLVSPTKAAAGDARRQPGAGGVRGEGGGGIIQEGGGDGSDALIQPKFGVYLPVDDFDEENEMKHEASQPLSRCRFVCPLARALSLSPSLSLSVGPVAG